MEVDEMKIPEFTAEVSLYKTNNQYQQRSGGGSSTGSLAVVPQQQSTCGDCTCDPGQCCKVGTLGGCQCYKCGGKFAPIFNGGAF
jgi:hypothetical protein